MDYETVLVKYEEANSVNPFAGIAGFSLLIIIVVIVALAILAVKYRNELEETNGLPVIFKVLVVTVVMSVVFFVGSTVIGLFKGYNQIKAFSEEILEPYLEQIDEERRENIYDLGREKIYDSGGKLNIDVEVQEGDSIIRVRGQVVPIEEGEQEFVSFKKLKNPEIDRFGLTRDGFYETKIHIPKSRYPKN